MKFYIVIKVDWKCFVVMMRFILEFGDKDLIVVYNDDYLYMFIMMFLVGYFFVFFCLFELVIFLFLFWYID